LVKKYVVGAKMYESKIKEIIADFPLFRKQEEKEKFFLVLGLLVSRQISLAKAAELMEIPRQELIFLLDKMGIDYHFLSAEDIKKEKSAVNKLLEELKK